MLHYAQKTVCQQLQKRSLIPGKYLNTDVLESTNAKNVEKVFFHLLINSNQPIYILFPLIPNFNFSYFNGLKMSFVDFA